MKNRKIGDMLAALASLAVVTSGGVEADRQPPAPERAPSEVEGPKGGGRARHLARLEELMNREPPPAVEPPARVAATRRWRAAWKDIGVRPGVGRVDKPRSERRSSWRQSRSEYLRSELALRGAA